MLGCTIRSVCIVAIASLLVGATVLAGDPWNTRDLWHTGNPWNAPTASPTPDTIYEPSSSVSAVPSVAERLLWGRAHAHARSGVGHYADSTDHDQWDWTAR
jgi:hypothetical protein